MTTHDPIPARLAALKTTATLDLKQQWRDLFDTAPPPFNRRYLESRLAYRIQELAYGGLKPATVARLEALGEQIDGGKAIVRGRRADSRPISGTRLIREYQGIEHCVTVRDQDFEYQGRPYKSLSAVARAITVCCPNGHVTPAQREVCTALLAAIGDVAWVDDEALIDPVTAVSGSGPAYVFYLVEALAAAGVKAGLPADLAMLLARRTVAGSGELLHRSDLAAGRLRENVTSPNGTTHAALQVLMAPDGLQPVLDRAIAAAARRSRELAG